MITSKYCFRVVAHVWTSNNPKARTLRVEQHNFECIATAFAYREAMRFKPLVQKIETPMLVDECGPAGKGE